MSEPFRTVRKPSDGCRSGKKRHWRHAKHADTQEKGGPARTPARQTPTGPPGGGGTRNGQTGSGGDNLQAASRTSIGVGCSAVTSSGQITHQSSGRISRRVTTPPPAASMGAQNSGGKLRRPSRQKHTAWTLTSKSAATAVGPPAAAMARLTADMCAFYKRRNARQHLYLILSAHMFSVMS